MVAPQRPNRQSLGRAQHAAWSQFEPVRVSMAVIPGLPPDGELILAGAEQAGINQPVYTVQQVSSIFLSRPRARWLRETLGKGTPPPGHRLWFSPLTATTMWTLGDVERMIRFLSSTGAIDYDRLVISMQLVMWTAKGYGLYV